MKIKELKDKIIKDIVEYPSFYVEEYWVFDILTLPKAMDNAICAAEWMPMGQSMDGKIINRLSNFWIYETNKNIKNR